MKSFWGIRQSSTSLYVLFFLSSILVGCGGSGPSPDPNSLCSDGFTYLAINESATRSITQEETQCFSFQGVEGKSYKVTLTNLAGDIDIAAHENTDLDENSVIVYSISQLNVDQLVFTAEHSQEYYIETYGSIRGQYTVVIQEASDSDIGFTLNQDNFTFSKVKINGYPDTQELVINSTTYYQPDINFAPNVTPDNQWLDYQVSIASLTRNVAINVHDIDRQGGIYESTLRVLVDTGYTRKVYRDVTIKYIFPSILDAFVGTSLFAQQSITGFDDIPVSYNLIYGPSGFAIDNMGNISWNPAKPLIGKSQNFSYLVEVVGQNSSVKLPGIVNVVNNNSTTIVRTEIYMPENDHMVFGFDHDADGKVEIILTDNDKLLYSLEFDGQKYSQDWVYPYELAYGEKIAAFDVADISNDGINDLIVTTSEFGKNLKIHLINGNTKEKFKSFDIGYREVKDIKVADIDKDNVFEVVILAQDDFSNQFFIVYNLADFTQEWVSSELIQVSTFETDIEIGNVDDDPQLEIITGSGYVYDGLSQTVEWHYSNGFAGFTTVETADVDGDGIDEIIGGDINGYPSSTIKIFDVRTKQLIFDAPIPNNHVLSCDIDNDNRDELFIGSKVLSYDKLTNSLTEIRDYQITGPFNNILIDDFDGDGIREIFFPAIGNNYNYRGENNFWISNLSSPFEIEYIYAVGKVTGPFVGGGIFQILPDKKHAIFAKQKDEVANPNGSRIYALSLEDGDILISDAIGDNLLSTDIAVNGYDFDSDSIDEVFIGTSALGTGTLAAFDFNQNANDFLVYPTGLQRDWRKMGFFDINSDSNNELMALNGKNTITYDFSSDQVLWSTNNPINGQLTSTDYAISELDGDPGKELVVVQYDNGDPLIVPQPYAASVSIYDHIGNTFNLVNSTTYLLSEITAISMKNIDSDPEDEFIFAVKNYNETTIVILEADMSESQRFSVNDEVVSIKFKPSYDSNMYYATGKNELVVFNLQDGVEISRTPSLLGAIQKHSLYFTDNNNGYYDLSVGTAEAMYIAH